MPNQNRNRRADKKYYVKLSKKRQEVSWKFCLKELNFEGDYVSRTEALV